MTKRKVADIIVTVIETAGWVTFAMNSSGPFFYGVMLLWTASILRRNLA